MSLKQYAMGLSLCALLSATAFATTAEGEAAFNQQRYEKAFTLLSPEAEKGDAKAQYLLGKMYYNGEGVMYNPEKTEKWLSASAKQGNADAQVLLAAF